MNPHPSGGQAGRPDPGEALETYVGIDIGSSYSKAVALSSEGEILARLLWDTPARAAREALADLERSLGRREGRIRVAVTGAGRTGAPFGDVVVHGVVCHARAGAWRVRHARAVVDMGCRASRVLILSPNGELADFVADDGWTGGMRRLLDLIAAAVDAEAPAPPGRRPHPGPLDLDESSLPHAERQVVSLLERGERPGVLRAAVEASIARRLARLLRARWRGGGIGPGQVVLTGGLARNGGIVQAVEGELGVPVTVDPEAPFLGAVGAALVGRRDLGARAA